MAANMPPGNAYLAAMNAGRFHQQQGMQPQQQGMQPQQMFMDAGQFQQMQMQQQQQYMTMGMGSMAMGPGLGMPQWVGQQQNPCQPWQQMPTGSGQEPP